ncbi:hypothetical protein GCM10007392_14120 [Saccharospirillum salsuginis]|uniref:Uncharacterized protein n=1 Tax=Saccharospirillum salsuginis TaxID=418750 RepID=A0A918N6X0_9GAMM|nr:hypothetical protein GCM10007392_14120 [Saccharospirillum salsuginis]
MLPSVRLDRRESIAYHRRTLVFPAPLEGAGTSSLIGTRESGANPELSRSGEGERDGHCGTVGETDGKPPFEANANSFASAPKSEDLPEWLNANPRDPGHPALPGHRSRAFPFDIESRETPR